MARPPGGCHSVYRAVCLAAILLPVPAAAQDEGGLPGPSQTLRVFLDCQNFFCDFDHFRREIAWVGWVRDRQNAEVHVLGTRQETGAGREFTFAFIGRERFGGRVDTLRFHSSGTDTDEEVRAGLVRTVALGLVRYAAATPEGERLRIVYQPPEGTEPKPLQESDPWNFWIFRLRVGGSADVEAQQQALSVNGSVSANRTTEDFKVELGGFGRFSRSEFELTDTTTFVDVSRRISANALVVWSAGSHVSAGIQATVGASTFVNQDLSVRAGPAVEFNVYPYDESTRRQITFLYRPGVAAFDYEEETIFGRTSEVRAVHALEVGVGVQQPWGSIFGSVEGFQFLHDPALHRVELRGGGEIRIVRGLSFNMFGSVARIKDQVFLPKAGLSDEEILTRRRQLGTDFELSLNVGLTFTFGSIYNTVVNPRMQAAGGFFF